MLVKELIKKLQEMPQEAEIIMSDDIDLDVAKEYEIDSINIEYWTIEGDPEIHQLVFISGIELGVYDDEEN